MDFTLRKINVKDTKKLTEQLHELFFTQPLAVLSTTGNSQPYCSLIAFAITDDLKDMIFATSRSTRKYTNIKSNARVSLLIDNRSNEVSDFHNAMAVTATGEVTEISEQEEPDCLRIYLKKHPHLEEFVMSPTSALMRVEVGKYYVVRRFQNVMVLQIRQ
ncbi:MAG TPA: pyridoxamine 5'-phosphate oxidase family protein [Deltaproteobacteria bacterium]|nr:pyridoxamine 5'-phosphate oxidase family protein [Deltaproteobacteria bacterium]